MIEKTTGYKVGDKFFHTIEEAQQAAIVEVIGDNLSEVIVEAVAKQIVDNKAEVIAILSLKQRGRPKVVPAATRKPRKRKVESVPTHEPEPEEKPHIKACNVKSI